MAVRLGQRLRPDASERVRRAFDAGAARVDRRRPPAGGREARRRLRQRRAEPLRQPWKDGRPGDGRGPSVMGEPALALARPAGETRTRDAAMAAFLPEPLDRVRGYLSETDVHGHRFAWIEPLVRYSTVTGYSRTAAGSYILHVRFTEELSPGSARATAASLTAGETDRFRISVQAAGRLEVYTTGQVNAGFGLRNSGGTALDKIFEGEVEGILRMRWDVAPGDYYVRVAGDTNTDTGPYTLHLRVGEVPQRSMSPSLAGARRAA